MHAAAGTSASPADSPRAAAPIVVLAVVVALAKLAHVLGPAVPAVVYALVFGVAAGYGARRAGHRNLSLPYEVPLTAGFVMMGAQVDASVFGLVGWRGLAGVALLWVAVVGAFWLAARLRLLPSRLAGLLALGLSGCGVSAVVAVSKQDPQSRGAPQTVATLVILLSGAAALLAYPVLGAHLDASTFGTFTGLTVANNAEAIATASTREHPAQLIAAAYKVVINAFEGLAIVLYLWLFAPRRGARKTRLALPRIPGFVIGFALVAAATLLGAFSDTERAALGNLTQWAFFIALVGVGFRTRLDQLLPAARPALLGLVLWALTAALVLAALLHL